MEFATGSKVTLKKQKNQLEKAERVAKIELDEDHMWKVRVKTEQAVLYKEEGKIDQMERQWKKDFKCVTNSDRLWKNWATRYVKL